MATVCSGVAIAWWQTTPSARVHQTPDGRSRQLLGHSPHNRLQSLGGSRHHQRMFTNSTHTEGPQSTQWTQSTNCNHLLGPSRRNGLCLVARSRIPPTQRAHSQHSKHSQPTAMAWPQSTQRTVSRCQSGGVHGFHTHGSQTARSDTVHTTDCVLPS